MKIEFAQRDDLQSILELQQLAYQSEARLFNNVNIPPLLQTLAEVHEEFAMGTILKATRENGEILGSVRACKKEDTLYIGKLIVHPDVQGNGIGTALLREIESICPSERYELFTSSKSVANLRLYERVGYRKFREAQIADDLKFVYLEKNRKDTI